MHEKYIESRNTLFISELVIFNSPVLQSLTMPLPPLMYTEKLTLYIGRDPGDGGDGVWHKTAKHKCQSQAKRFDLGCSKPRKISNHVFCMKAYCVCYVQYGQCEGLSFLGKLVHLVSTIV